ncbi:hypothetical protein INF26_04940 [Olsenella sp. DSM 107455]|uniref:Uncharacterized protein n=1 Tax=Thermophilibacter gallinarum TaxID=2779357 RepID=A0ABR9QTX8_9ACTN|nr:hypothetical protein [Thermophilibacter gallinarum]MBE5024197.1 hypothetical protein [Thermophilibacter gallinarum]
MSGGQEQSSQHLGQIVEPTDDEKAAARAARTFGRSFAHDSVALGVAAFALVFFIVFVVVIVTLVGGVARDEYGGQDVTWLAMIGGSVFVVFAALAVASVLVARHHYLHPGKSDVFAVGGRLFHTSFMRDKEKHEDGCGTVRINVVGIADCTGFHNRKDGTVWILPGPGARIRDVWRRGRRWEDERELCLALLEKGIPNSADTDPFFGVDEQYRGFLERIGVRIEETTKPVDFLAGTWS